MERIPVGIQINQVAIDLTSEADLSESLNSLIYFIYTKEHKFIDREFLHKWLTTPRYQLAPKSAMP